MQLVTDMQAPLTDKTKIEIQKRLAIIKADAKLEFPEYNAYPYNVREIFEYYKAIIHKEDIIDFSKGKLFRDNLINCYFKILEKVNLLR